MGNQSHAFRIRPRIRSLLFLDCARAHVVASKEDGVQAVAAIMESFSALEAFLNEISQWGSGYQANGFGINHKMVAMGQALSKAESKHKPVIKKIALAYNKLTGKDFKKSEFDYRRTSLVVRVRNELVHPKAPTVDLNDPSKLSAIEEEIVQELSYYGLVNPELLGKSE